ncbi:uncharacterized protein LOC131630962 [Vicia villosa]|uniref:uncharacterized protein LOC131630962 n=1 Tax=Vicia villosa TaxID=3911 RepID=UPI00273BD50C|nr:uncharacterized protein LOC131630962 [Vicia villosa]
MMFKDIQALTTQGTRFKCLLKYQTNHANVEEGIKCSILCSQKVYYELDDKRTKVHAKDVAICRVEQICPFPYDIVRRELKRYPSSEVVWCQEEPMNMSGYTYVLPQFITSMKSLGRGRYDDIKYVGRALSAATAIGFLKVYHKE